MVKQRQYFSEHQFYNFLSHYCDKNEQVILEPRNMEFTSDSIRYYPDIYLPSGCKALNLKSKTLIEVKSRLTFDTIQWLRVFSDTFRDTFEAKGYTFVCVFILDVDVPELIGTGFPKIASRFGEHFQIKTLEQLKKLVNNNILSRQEVKEQEHNILVINKAIAALRTENCSFVLGAGVSIDAKLPSWETLLKRIIKNAQQKKQLLLGENDYNALLKDCGSSSIILGRLACTLFDDDSDEFVKAIKQALYQGKKFNPGNLATSICKLIKYKYNKQSLTSVITYNYDDLIEEGLRREKLILAPVFGNQQPGTFIPVYHVHGYLPQEGDVPSNIVLSEREYHDIYKKAYDWSNVEQLHAMQRSVCFFIGLSMTDPNLRRLLDIANDNQSNNPSLDISHFAFLNKAETAKGLTGKKAEEFCDKIEDMLRGLGVAVVWYKDYPDLPKLLDSMIA